MKTSESTENLTKRIKNACRVYGEITHTASLILPLAFLIGYDEVANCNWMTLYSALRDQDRSQEWKNTVRALDPVNVYRDLLGIIGNKGKYTFGSKAFEK